jgi:hypothetical protein
VGLQKGGELTLNFTANIFFQNVKLPCYSSLLRNVGGLIRRQKASCNKDKTDDALSVTEVTIFREFED